MKSDKELRLSVGGQQLIKQVLEHMSGMNGNIIQGFTLTELGTHTTRLTVILKPEKERTGAPGFVSDMGATLSEVYEELVRMAYRIYRVNEPLEVELKIEFAEEAVDADQGVRYITVELQPGDLVPGLDQVHDEMADAQGDDTLGASP